MMKQQQRPKSSLLLLLSLSILLKVCAAATSAVQYEDGLILKQVHVVTRHGSRHALPKGADGLTPEQEMDTNSALTAFGRKQMYDLGEWLQATYYSQNDDAEITFESSPYHRTIGSAIALALGLMNITSTKTFSTTSVPSEIFTGLPPVFMSEADNDVYIRAYDKCPTFTNKLNSLYTSAQWLQLQTDSMPLLQSLATIEEFKQYVKAGEGSDPAQYIPLKEIWNVFDSVHVAKTECAASDLGPEFFTNELVPLQQEGKTCGEAIEDWISTDDWQELVQVAHTVELLKYNGGPHQKDPAADTAAGKLIGANLLGRILDRMMHNSESSSGDSKPNAPDLYVYSAHYATVLGLFSALQEPFFVDQNLSDETGVQSELLIIPTYGSALIMEYYQDTKSTSANAQWLLRVRFKNDGETDDNDSDVTLVPLKTVCSQLQSSSSLSITRSPTEYCPIGELSEALWEVLADDDSTAPSWSDMPKKWCKACGNEKASVCMQQLLQENKGVTSTDDSSSSNKDSSSGSSGSGFWNGAPSTTTTPTTTTHEDQKKTSSTSSTTTSATCDDGLDRPVLTGILLGLGMAVALVGMVWGIMCCIQLYEKHEISKGSAGSVMKEPSSHISTIMQETIGDDTIMEESAAVEEEITVAVTTEQDGSKTLAETADMA